MSNPKPGAIAWCDLTVADAEGVRSFYDRADRMLWESKLDGAAMSAPAVTKNRVYVGTDVGAVVCLDIKNGRECWRVDAGAPVVASPVIVANRCVAASTDGDVIGLIISADD